MTNFRHARQDSPNRHDEDVDAQVKNAQQMKVDMHISANLSRVQFEGNGRIRVQFEGNGRIREQCEGNGSISVQFEYKIKRKDRELSEAWKNAEQDLAVGPLSTPSGLRELQDDGISEGLEAAPINTGRLKENLNDIHPQVFGHNEACDLQVSKQSVNDAEPMDIDEVDYAVPMEVDGDRASDLSPSPRGHH